MVGAAQIYTLNSVTYEKNRIKFNRSTIPGTPVTLWKTLKKSDRPLLIPPLFLNEVSLLGEHLPAANTA